MICCCTHLLCYYFLSIKLRKEFRKGCVIVDKIFEGVSTWCIFEQRLECIPVACNSYTKRMFSTVSTVSLSSHLSLNREGRWGTINDFATSFLHFSLFSTALWDLANSRLVFFPLSLCLARWFWPDLINGRHDHTTAVSVSLRWS